MTSKKETRHSLRMNIAAGLVVVLVLMVSAAGWASVSRISGAVIAPGVLVVDSNVKRVQHLQGGIVGEILVKNGDEVQAGDVVVRLDPTQIEANLAVLSKAIDQFTARQARLKAELSGSVEIDFPKRLLEKKTAEDTSQILQLEQDLFRVRRQSRRGQKSRLRERIEQFKQEIVGLRAQAKAKETEIGLINRELAGARDLWAKGLISITKLTQLEREATRIAGETGSLQASIAQAMGRISETETQILQVDWDLGREAATELGQLTGRLGELEERRIVSEDQLRRIELRAPQDGIVHKLTAHTVGGVIRPGTDVMLIVPQTDELIVETKVFPRDIDQVYPQQAARLRFSALSQHETPEINGTVATISADVTTDERSGTSYYIVRIELAENELQRLGDISLVPGMPVEAFIQTKDRSVVSYLIKPLGDQMVRAFREE